MNKTAAEIPPKKKQCKVIKDTHLTSQTSKQIRMNLLPSPFKCDKHSTILFRAFPRTVKLYIMSDQSHLEKITDYFLNIGKNNNSKILVHT